MEQELRFGLDLGQLAVLKKGVWADYQGVFSCFQGEKNLKLKKHAFLFLIFLLSLSFFIG